VNDQQIFAGPLRVWNIVVAVPRPSRTGRVGTRRLPSFGRGFQIRVEHRHLGVELGLDLGKRDFALRLDLKMDGVVLRLLLLGLRLMDGGGLVGLRLRLRDQQFWVGRRRRRCGRRMQQLPGPRIDRGGIAEEPVGVLVSRDPRQLGRGVVEPDIAVCRGQ